MEQFYDDDLIGFVSFIDKSSQNHSGPIRRRDIVIITPMDKKFKGRLKQLIVDDIRLNKNS